MFSQVYVCMCRCIWDSWTFSPAGYFISDFLDGALNQPFKQSWEVLLHHSAVIYFTPSVCVRVCCVYSKVAERAPCTTTGQLFDDTFVIFRRQRKAMKERNELQIIKQIPKISSNAAHMYLVPLYKLFLCTFNEVIEYFSIMTSLPFLR